MHIKLVNGGKSRVDVNLPLRSFRPLFCAEDRVAWVCVMDTSHFLFLLLIAPELEHCTVTVGGSTSLSLRVAYIVTILRGHRPRKWYPEEVPIPVACLQWDGDSTKDVRKLNEVLKGNTGRIKMSFSERDFIRFQYLRRIIIHGHMES
jgi:hypothetical protein